jgi:hypothetical protein
LETILGQGMTSLGKTENLRKKLDFI